MRKAFTLIELLVVVSIIALLIAILLPVLGAARLSAQEAQCAVDQRSLGQAAYTWATDNDGVLPDLGKRPSSGTISNALYITFTPWKESMEEYGAIRSNWYSPTNDAWNRDDFYDPQPGDMFYGQLVYGRFYFAGSKPNSTTVLNALVASTTVTYDPNQLAFANSVEDNPQFDFLWTDLNRVWPAGSGNFTTPGDPNRKGANHLGDDPLLPRGSHVTSLDGSTTWTSGNEMESRITFGGADFWW